MTKIIYDFCTFPTKLQCMNFPSRIIFQRFIVFITVYKRLLIISSLLILVLKLLNVNVIIVIDTVLDCPTWKSNYFLLEEDSFL